MASSSSPSGMDGFADTPGQRYDIKSAAKCSVSVPPWMFSYASWLISSHIFRLIFEKDEMYPLCMMVWMPNVNGWLLVGVMAVDVAARMCAKRTLLEVFLHKERKLGSCNGGWMDL